VVKYATTSSNEVADGSSNTRKQTYNNNGMTLYVHVATYLEITLILCCFCFTGVTTSLTSTEQNVTTAGGFSSPGIVYNIL
jgi:hypothetical protein